MTVLVLGAAAAGCKQTAPPAELILAPGVTLRRDENKHAQTIAVDLAVATVRPVVVARNVTRLRNNFVGDARTVQAWASATPGALAGMNGGFFGDTYDTAGRRKQIVQLAVVDGSVVAPGSSIRAAPGGQRYLRSAVGFTADGTPSLAWASGSARAGAMQSATGVDPVGKPTRWPINAAVACGPRLIAQGVRRTDAGKNERLVDPDRVPRAFIAFDRVGGKPAHLVFGRADAMDYAAVTDFLEATFKTHFGTYPTEAMCLDGGPSAQLVYRDPANGQITDTEPTGVFVPTAILLVKK